MDKQATAKFELLLQGLVSRITDEFDFFVGLTGEFSAGAKKTPVVVTPEEDGLHVRIGAGGRRFLPQAERATGLAEALRAEAARQDRLVLEAVFRQEALQLSAGDTKATVRTIARQDTAAAMVPETSRSPEGLHAQACPLPGVTGTRDIGVAEHAWPATGGLLAHREYLVKPGEADALLKEIGIMAQNGKIRNDRIRKYNQIDHFVELLVPLLQTLMAEKRELFIVDCACGKSYLSFVLNHFLLEGMKQKARFLGIDISAGVIASSQQSAKRLGYRNMTFLQGDLRTLLVEEGGPVDRAPDLVISLHACDVATDYALAFGMRNRARAIVSVPCCQHELVNRIRTDDPMAELLRHGLLKARFADVLTDGLRCLMLEAAGYEVSCVEWVSPLETPKNLMIRAERKSGGNREKQAAYEALARRYHARLTLEEEMIGFL
jgi:SAM-dependent methyltransferase